MQAVETTTEKAELPTPWEKRVLDFVLHTFAKEGTAPTLREIMTEFGWKSTNAAHDTVSGLKRKGYLIQPKRGVARGIRLTPKALGMAAATPDAMFCPACRLPLHDKKCVGPDCQMKWRIEPAGASKRRKRQV